MKRPIAKILYCITFLLVQISSHAQEVNMIDPLASLSEKEIENLKREYGSTVIKSARSEEIAQLLLGPYASIEMGKLKAEYHKGTRALKNVVKTDSEFKKEKEKLKKHYYEQVKQLLDEDRYAQWQHYIEFRAERTYMKEYGFSAEQIASYSHEAFKATQREEISRLNLSPEIAIMMGELIVSYKTERAFIKNSDLDVESIKSILKYLDDSHQNNVRILIGEDKYHIWKPYIDDAARRVYAHKYGLPIEQISQYTIDAVKMANSAEIQHLSLSPLDAIRMGEIKVAYKQAAQDILKGDPNYKAKRRML